MDHPVDRIKRGEALARNANFRTCHVFVFDSRGRLLLQRLAGSRDRFPERWGSSAAAYLYAGERYGAAARRRLQEEIGLTTSLRYVGKTRMNDQRSLKFVALFTTRADGATIRDRSHIDELQYLPIDEIVMLINDKPEAFTPTFLHVFSFYRESMIALGCDHAA